MEIPERPTRIAIHGAGVKETQGQLKAVKKKRKIMNSNLVCIIYAHRTGSRTWLYNKTVQQPCTLFFYLYTRPCMIKTSCTCLDKHVIAVRP